MVDVIDTDGVKPILPKGVLAYDDYAAGGDAGRLYIGTGVLNKPIATLSDIGGTVDSVPTNGSTNAVSSDGVFDALALKASLVSPALTGTPTAPTATVGDNSTKLATTAFVNAEITDYTYSKTEINTKLAAQNDASEISVTSSGNLASTNVQAALVELQGDIDNRYTKSETDTLLADKAADSSVVHKTGNETIAGVKTFSSTIAGSINGNSATATTATTATSAGSCTGNSATATKLTNSSGDWQSSGAIANVVGMLAWKNYGNGYVIFDASSSTSPTGSAANNTNAQIPWTPTYPTLMGWNGSSTFGVRVDSARVADNTTYASAFTTAVGSAPSYACRAWVNFNGTGTVAIRASGNVSSITDNGVGDYTVNFTTAMPDVNYGYVTGIRNSGGTSSMTIQGHQTVAQTNSSIRLEAVATTTRFDIIDLCVSIFR